MINTEKRIVELKEISEMASDFEDIKAKAEKKYQKSIEFKLFIQSDIEDNKNIQYSLIYNIYASKLDNLLKIKKFRTNKNLKEYVSEAQKFTLNAKKISEDAITAVSDEKMIGQLKQSNGLYNKAIQNQRAAISICLKLDLPTVANCNSIAMYEQEKKYNNNSPSVEIMDNDEEVLQEKPAYFSDNSKGKLKVEINDISAIASKDRLEINNAAKVDIEIIFKVQVGAFYSGVDTEAFNGLNPISIDESDRNYSKALVGNYHSYKAALKARSVIVNTTKYKDAFVVAYKNGERISIKKALEHKNKDRTDRQAYITFKNTTVK